MKPPSGPKKQTQFKPNFFKGQNELKIDCQKIRPHPLLKTDVFCSHCKDRCDILVKSRLRKIYVRKV